MVKYLLSTEMIPLCLKNMESPFEKTKIVRASFQSPHHTLSSHHTLQVATFIVQRILHDETGLNYVCSSFERFSQVAMILVRHCCAPCVCSCTTEPRCRHHRQGQGPVCPPQACRAVLPSSC